MALDTSLDGLVPEAREAWLALASAAEHAGYVFAIRSARRTCVEQAEQWAIGRLPGDTRKVVTHAKGCNSWHVQGRAVDVAMKTGTYAEFGALAKSLGWKWGGDFPGFPDVGHVEYHPGLTLATECPNPDHCDDGAYPRSDGWGDPGGGGSIIQTPSFSRFLAYSAAAIGMAVLIHKVRT